MDVAPIIGKIMNNKYHPHRDLMIKFANDANIRIQEKIAGSDVWSRRECPAWIPEFEYREEPTKNVIDMSVLIKSGIDCEFKTGAYDRIGPLVKVCNERGRVTYDTHQHSGWLECQPRMSPHIHFWQGGDCPLPKGFRVKVYHIRGNTSIGLAEHFNWSKQVYYQYAIIGFEILGLPMTGIGLGRKSNGNVY